MAVFSCAGALWTDACNKRSFPRSDLHIQAVVAASSPNQNFFFPFHVAAMTFQVAGRMFHGRRSTQIKVKGVFCAFYRKFRIFYRKLTKKPNWSPKRTWRLGICPWGLHSSMFPLLTPFPSFFSCHYASFLKTVSSTGSSEFLQETSCRTFGWAKSNSKSESDGGSLLVRPASTCVSIPCLHPSFFFTSLCFSLCFYRIFQ